MKRTVVKVNINCQICKSDVLKAVTKLSGDVDPVLIVKKVRKIGKAAEVVSVGPPKPEPKKSPKYILLPPYCNDCQFVGVGFTPYDGRLCHIL
nr:heavy metal-associated isoprenylated plant protein 43-like [Ziziphus jujuba var. spinosa]